MRIRLPNYFLLIFKDKELIQFVHVICPRSLLRSAEQASASRWQGSCALIRESGRVFRSDARSRQGERNREPRDLILRRLTAGESKFARME